MKNKTFLIAIIIFIAMTVVSQIILPKAAEDATEKANIPKPDFQYVKVGRIPGGADPFSGYTEVELSDSDKTLVKDYINFGGRDWKADEDPTVSGSFIVEINKDQCFVFTPSTQGEIKLGVVYYSNTADGAKKYTTERSGTAAAARRVRQRGAIR